MRISLSDSGARGRDRLAVGLWLLGLAAMVLVMVVLGGVTRLTGSGLSMVEWQPLTVLPPLDHAAWQELFARYQASPQYRLVNLGMSLEQFQGIFWLEYVHRLWGRLIGLAFLLPFAAFLAKGWISRPMAGRLAALFVLGGVQGVLGWLMVRSGLSDRPEVSHIRLAAHLTMALAIYAALLWCSLDILEERVVIAGARRLRRTLRALLGLLCLTIPAGALVAGLHAGLIYNSFPLMGGRLIPAEAFDLSPWWQNFFDNHALVQWDHRLLAIGSWGMAVAVWLVSRRAALPVRARWAVRLVPLAATLQAGLGIATLLTLVPVPLAAMHQAGAFVLFGVSLWALHEVRG